MTYVRSQEESQEDLLNILNRQIRNCYLSYYDSVLDIRIMSKPMIRYPDRKQGV